MKFYQLTTTLVILSEIWIAGCQPYPNYEAYHDVENRGEAIFKRDLENCKSFADQHLKPAEGSEGAGERFNRKRSFMRNCMGNKQWILKN
jgi:hypothetical protein